MKLTLQDLTPGNIFKNGNSIFMVTPDNIDWAIQQVQGENCCLEGIELSLDLFTSKAIHLERIEKHLADRWIFSLGLFHLEVFCNAQVAIRNGLSAGTGICVLSQIHQLQKFTQGCFDMILPVDLTELEKALGMKVTTDIERNYRFGFGSKAGGYKKITQSMNTELLTEGDSEIKLSKENWHDSKKNDKSTNI